MIEYANELIEEIKAQKPSNATPITIQGVYIERVAYDGVGLSIYCNSLDFIDKDDYNELEQEKKYLEWDKEELEDEIGRLESELGDYRKACLDIREFIDNYEENSEIIDKIYEILDKVDK